MQRSRIQIIASIGFVCLLLLLGINDMAGEIGVPPDAARDAALAECRAKGWQDGDLAQTGFKATMNVLGSTASIVLKSRDPRRPATVRIQLRKQLNLMRWEVVDYKAE